MLRHWTVLGVALAMVAFPRASRAQEGHAHDEAKGGHSHEMCELHGGEATMTPAHHFETLFTGKEVRLYVYDAKQKPVLDPKDAKVNLVLTPKKGKEVALTLSYLGPDPELHRSQGYFVAEHKLAAIEPDAWKAGFTITGLAKDPVIFKTPVMAGNAAVYMCPMGCEGIQSADPGACPVCGMDFKRRHAEAKEHDGDDDHSDHDHH